MTGAAEMTRVLVFDGSALAQDAAGDGSLHAADSWLVVNHRARFLSSHRDRFAAACRQEGVPAGTVSRFWQAAIAELPAEGRWFPRAELAASGQLRLRLRPAPHLGTQLTVWVADGPDPRQRPRRKGPDLPALHDVRERAAAHGADEALLTTASGEILEGATTSMIWWEGGTLCVPADDLPVLAGVTSGWIQRRAQSLGVTVARRHTPVGRLDGAEVWGVNALHGIRPVTGWSGASLVARPASRAAAWKAWLESQFAEIGTG